MKKEKQKVIVIIILETNGNVRLISMIGRPFPLLLILYTTCRNNKKMKKNTFPMLRAVKKTKVMLTLYQIEKGRFAE